MGFTQRVAGFPCFEIVKRQSGRDGMPFDDGVMSRDGLVWGTYLHGVFDQPGFRRAWLNRIRDRKGLAALDVSVSQAVSGRLVETLDRWAEHLEQHIQVSRIFSHFDIH